MISQPFKRTLYHATLKKGGGGKFVIATPLPGQGPALDIERSRLTILKIKILTSVKILFIKSFHCYLVTTVWLSCFVSVELVLLQY